MLQGHCKSFDASANGYTRSDGIAVVVISRPGLQHAAWHVRAPYARVLASATNNDGHTTEGVTFPSGSAQRDLAEKVSHEPCDLGLPMLTMRCHRLRGIIE